MSAHCRKFSLYSLISALGISLAFIGVPSSTGAPQQSGALAGENPQSLEQPQSTSDEPDVLARSSDTTQPIGKLESAPHVDCSSMPWLDTSLSASKRADLLLSQSEETQVFRWLVEQPANYPSQNSFNGVDYSDQLPCTPTVNYTDGPEGYDTKVPLLTRHRFWWRQLGIQSFLMPKEELWLKSLSRKDSKEFWLQASPRDAHH